MKKQPNLKLGRYWSNLNEDQHRAVRQLARMLAKWPPGISLFGNAGSLTVTLDTDMDADTGDAICVVACIDGVHCDGGDLVAYIDGVPGAGGARVLPGGP